MFAIHIQFQAKITCPAEERWNDAVGAIERLADSCEEIEYINEFAFFTEKMGGEKEAIKWIIERLSWFAVDCGPFDITMAHADERPVYNNRVATYKQGNPKSLSDVYRWAMHNQLTLRDFIGKIHQAWRAFQQIDDNYKDNFITVIDPSCDPCVDDELFFDISVYEPPRGYKVDTR